MNKWIRRFLISIIMISCVFTSGCVSLETESESKVVSVESVEEIIGDEAQEFEGEPFVVINDNVPEFPEEDLTEEPFEEYSSLDELGRCGEAYANISVDTMPTEERESIGQVKPSGWQIAKYDYVDGKYLYNRCHLIGFQLTGENANEENLITGTRYLNVVGMLPFENMVAEYVEETGNHVLYRVTPIFEGDNLVASGVQMEAESVEDNGAGIMFNVYCYNVQPGVEIDYAEGDNWEEDLPEAETTGRYVLNTNTYKFHLASCSSVADMEESNMQGYDGSRDKLLIQGYEPCKRCNP